MATLDSGISVASGVSLNDTMIEWLNNLRAVLSDSVPIYVTSGTRTAAAQGSAMYAKYLSAGGGDSGWQELYSTYRDDSIIDDIKDDVDGWLTTPTESGFQSALASIEARGLLDNLTDHAAGDALDLRTRDLTSSQTNSLIAAAEALGARTLLEAYPPHLHVDGLSLGAMGVARIPLVGTVWAKTKAVVAGTPTWAIYTIAIVGVAGAAGAIWWASQDE